MNVVLWDPRTLRSKMSGLGDKIKNIRSLLKKGGKNRSINSPFSGNSDPFSSAPPGFGLAPDISAGMSFSPGVPSPPGMPAGLSLSS